MVLDINLFRKEKGGNPDKIKESEKNRFHDEKNVDKVIEFDEKWRKCIFKLEELKKEMNVINKEIGNKIKADKNADISDLKEKCLSIKEEIPLLQNEEKYLIKQRHAYLSKIGNILNPKVVISNDEVNNKVIKLWGSCKKFQVIDNINDNSLEKKQVHNNINEIGNKLKYYYHFDLLKKINGVNFKKGIQAAGHRGYYLTGPGFLLHNAILQYGLNFLVSKNYFPVYPPFFMKKSVMEECAELSEFEETLYRIPATNVNEDNNNNIKNKNLPSEELSKDDLFFIATSEQPLCALHKDEILESENLPIRYAGFSSCFRKEAGAHGKDIRGLIRVHQFDKIEQFCITKPEKSSKMHQEMIMNCEEFYQSLNIPYRIINIVSGALNDAASIKYDIEGHFPSCNQYRELVSASNCTDYQSINLNIKYRDPSQKNVNVKKKESENLNEETNSDYEHFCQNFQTESKNYVHLLNSTLVSGQRFLCCVLENYQNGEGIVIPDKLVPYMNNVKFIPFVE